MPLNEKHKAFIKRNISDVIHTLSDVGEGELTERRIVARLNNVKKVLRGGNDFVVYEGDEDSEIYLGHAHDLLAHDCPQNFSKEEVKGLMEVAVKNVVATVSSQYSDYDTPLSLDSETVSQIRHNNEAGTYDVTTLLGARLDGQKYGLLGLTVLDSDDCRSTKEDVQSSVVEALNKVEQSLDVKLGLIRTLRNKELKRESGKLERELDEGLLEIYDLILHSNNSEDPSSPTNEVKARSQQIIEGKSKSLPKELFRDWCEELSATVPMLIPLVRDKQSATRLLSSTPGTASQLTDEDKSVPTPGTASRLTDEDKSVLAPGTKPQPTNDGSNKALLDSYFSYLYSGKS